MLYNQRRRSANDTTVFQRWANVDTMLYHQRQLSANDTTIFQRWANIVMSKTVTGQLAPLRFDPWSTRTLMFPTLIYPSQLALHTVSLLGQLAS